MKSQKEKLNDLIQRQRKHGWNIDRQRIITKLQRAVYGTIDNVVFIPKTPAGQFAARHGGNEREKEFIRQASNAGWTLSKRGWPDFFMWKDGKIACVEVKPDLGCLRANQKAILSALASYGIPCFTWRPTEGFKRVTADELKAAIKTAMEQSA